MPVVGRACKRACRILGKRVARYPGTGRPALQRVRRPLGRHEHRDEGRRPLERVLRFPDRLRDVGRTRRERRDEDGHDRIREIVPVQHLERLPVVLGGCCGDHVERVRKRSPREAGTPPARRVPLPAAQGPRGRAPRTRRRTGSRGRPRSSRSRRVARRGSGWLASSEATSKSSASVSVRITPAWPEQRVDGHVRADDQRAGVR